MYSSTYRSPGFPHHRHRCPRLRLGRSTHFQSIMLYFPSRYSYTYLCGAACAFAGRFLRPTGGLHWAIGEAFQIFGTRATIHRPILASREYSKSPSDVGCHGTVRLSSSSYLRRWLQTILRDVTTRQGRVLPGEHPCVHRWTFWGSCLSCKSQSTRVVFCIGHEELAQCWDAAARERVHCACLQPQLRPLPRNYGWTCT